MKLIHSIVFQQDFSAFLINCRNFILRFFSFAQLEILFYNYTNFYRFQFCDLTSKKAYEIEPYSNKTGIRSWFHKPG